MAAWTGTKGLSLSVEVLGYTLLIWKMVDGSWSGEIWFARKATAATFHGAPNETEAKRRALSILSVKVVEDFDAQTAPLLEEVSFNGWTPATRVLLQPRKSRFGDDGDDGEGRGSGVIPITPMPPPAPLSFLNQGVIPAPALVCTYCGLEYRNHPEAGDGEVVVCNLGRVKI